ncbi:MAG: hypothetical protein Q8M88_17090 [Phenylobacterium sp.]|uniref:hypothetical protein n=1 Tax=Phenylobacterium sp. TaxID=1871053 RepID=UPI002734D7DE|nr:hypothetical protein [Phenylobacterium sp.]MDP3176143.1 hypothetical protein [Phenylobacterium sp.]
MKGIALALAVAGFGTAASGQVPAAAPTWFATERFATISSSELGAATTFQVRCEPSASGGRTIPSFHLTVPIDYVPGFQVTPNTSVEMKLEMRGERAGDAEVAFLLNTTEFGVSGSGSGIKVTFVGYGGSDVGEAAARAVLRTLSASSSVTVSARPAGGNWVRARFSSAGANAALAKTWCRE